MRTAPLSPSQIRLNALVDQHKPKRKQKRVEGELKTRLTALATRFRTRLWVNTVGLFYNRVGTPISCGLHKSSSDLIGYRIILVTQEMVGRQLAQFVAAEVKAPDARTDPAHLARQQAWIAAVVQDGGIGGIVRSEEELIALLR